MPSATVNCSAMGSCTTGEPATGTHSTWAASRNATTSTVSQTNSGTNYDCGPRIISGRGGLSYRLSRTYITWNNLSSYAPSITALSVRTTMDAALGIVNYRCVQSTAYGTGTTTTLVSGDFDSNGSNTNTLYASSQIAFSANSVTTISLNSTAVAYANSNSKLIIGYIEDKFDYSNFDPGSAGNYYGEFDFGSTANHTLTVTYTTGFSHEVNGVSGANIDEINGVSTSDIDELNGVS